MRGSLNIPASPQNDGKHRLSAGILTGRQIKDLCLKDKRRKKQFSQHCYQPRRYSNDAVATDNNHLSVGSRVSSKHAQADHHYAVVCFLFGILMHCILLQTINTLKINPRAVRAPPAKWLPTLLTARLTHRQIMQHSRTRSAF